MYFILNILKLVHVCSKLDSNEKRNKRQGRKAGEKGKGMHEKLEEINDNRAFVNGKGNKN